MAKMTATKFHRTLRFEPTLRAGVKREEQIAAKPLNTKPCIVCKEPMNVADGQYVYTHGGECKRLLKKAKAKNRHDRIDKRTEDDTTQVSEPEGNNQKVGATERGDEGGDSIVLAEGSEDRSGER